MKVIILAKEIEAGRVLFVDGTKKLHLLEY